MLAAVQGNLFLAKKHVGDNQAVAKKLQVIEALAKQASGVVRQLLTFASKDVVEMEPVKLNHFMREGFRLAKTAIPENIEHTLELCEEEMTCMADVTQLQQAMINLSNNARDAVADVPQPKIVCSLRKYQATDEFREANPDVKHEQFALISVRDNGSGIAAEHMRAIFDPFFTTKGPGKGTGLGLAMVYGSVQRHGGVLDVESEPGVGTAFHIYLPLSQDISGKDIQDNRQIMQAEGETVLLVDDEESLRETTAEVLRSFGYQVLEAADGEQALQLYLAEAGKVDLLLTDVVMPKMSGIELAREIRKLAPMLPIILASGYDGEKAPFRVEQVEHSRFLNKPYSYEGLSRLIRRLLDGDAGVNADKKD